MVGTVDLLLYSEGETMPKLDEYVRIPEAGGFFAVAAMLSATGTHRKDVGVPGSRKQLPPFQG